MVALQQVYLCVNSNSQFKVHKLLICLITTPERSLLSRATDSTINLEFMKILHLSTYIMETRRNRNQLMFQMKRKSQKVKNWQKNLKKWEDTDQNSNVRSDAARLKKMRKNNWECKKVKRDLQRQAIQSGITKLEKRKHQDAKKHLDEKIQRKKENKEQKN